MIWQHIAQPIKRSLVPLGRRAQCVFVLSTGRCGTTTLRSLLDASGHIQARHEPYPELLRETWQAYQDFPMPKAAATQLMNRFAVSRTRPLLKAALGGSMYAECSNRMTYIAPLLADFFPRSRFIHLYRNPAAVVRSAMRRRYFDLPESEQTDWDRYRTVPRPSDPYGEQWASMTPFEKSCWFWHAVNEFSLDFMGQLSAGRGLSIQAEALFANDPAVVHGLFEWLGIETPPDSISATALVASTNAQNVGDFPVWDDWTDEQRATLWRIAGSTISELCYTNVLSGI